jgi:iron-sulfur cluster repair protein YtfE (RIC family)
MTATQPLRDEHEELIPHIEALRTAADAAGDAAPEVLRTTIEESFDFLTHHLIPHAQAEERALYPVVGKVLGAPAATRTMSRDHVEVGRLTEQLREVRAQIATGKPSAHQIRDLHRILYGLYALVSVHFAKEEEVYLPLLDSGLSADAAQRMFKDMEKAAAEAKAAAGVDTH